MALRQTGMAKQILLFIIVFIALPTANSSEHSPCLTNCQSSEIRRQCDTLYCKNGCVPGWYGAQCTRRCSPLCLEALCDRESGRCTIGCIRTWMTQRHYRQCQAKISRRSTRGKCLRDKNGTCECCESGYRGDSCEIPCTSCVTIPSVLDPCYICKSGYYGDSCENECPNTCELGNQGKPVCIKSLTDDTFECERCHSGKYGTKCEKSCSLKCKNKTCYQLGGSCVRCKENYFGEDCDKNCSRQCIDGCHRNGTCVSGCKPGFQGHMCNIQCVTNCTDCSSTDTEACIVNCDDNCPIKECYPNQTCTCQNDDCSGCLEKNCYILSKDKKDKTINQATESSSVKVVVAVVVTLLLLLLIIIIVICYCVRKRRQTPQQDESQLQPMITKKAGDGQTFEDMQALGSELRPDVLVFTVFDLLEETIENKLQNKKDFKLKHAGTFTSGEIGSKKVIIMKIPTENASLVIPNFISGYFGYFQSAEHVLITGLCSRPSDIDQHTKVIVSVATEQSGCIYYGQSKNYKAEDPTLQQIVKGLKEPPSECKDNIKSRDMPTFEVGAFVDKDGNFEDRNADNRKLAFDREIKPLLDSVTGNTKESFLMVFGVTSNPTSSRKSLRAASNDAAKVVSEIIKRIE